MAGDVGSEGIRFKPDYVFLSEARTGSGLLGNLIGQHKHTLYFCECFNYGNVQRNNTQFKDLNLLQIYQKMDRLAKEKGRFYGFKNHVSIGLRNKVYDGCQNPFKYWWKHLHEDTKVLILQRRNKLRQFVSYRKAQILDEWQVRDNHKNKNREPVQQPVYVNNNVWMEQIHTWDQYQAVAEQLFPNSPVVYYEDVVADLDKTWNFMLEYFCLPKQEMPKIPTKKQQKLPLRKAIKNYEELKSLHKGTKLEEYFED